MRTQVATHGGNTIASYAHVSDDWQAVISIVYLSTVQQNIEWLGHYFLVGFARASEQCRHNPYAE